MNHASLSGIVLLSLASSVSVASGAGDADIDYGREWTPYATLRGGWAFGKGTYCQKADGIVDWSEKRSLKNAWSGSGEFGVSCCDGRLQVGLELGYFTQKLHIDHTFNPPDAVVGMTKCNGDGKFENFFGACNVTLRRDCTERLFLYGGVGAGLVRTTLTGNDYEEGTLLGTWNESSQIHASKWRFLGQGFAGFGVYLNDCWTLSLGYRLRWMPGDLKTSATEDGAEWKSTFKQNVLHAAEVGLTYQF